VTALGIRWTFFGELVVNANYNTSTMVVGSIPGFAQLRSPATTGQFNVSPGNTFLGVTATPPSIGPVQLQARFDMDFRSNAPYLNENAFLPLVRDLYLEARWSRLRLLAGQAADIISPRSSASLNFYPLSFIPGDIGDYRPQLRVEWHQQVTDWMEIIVQAAIAQAVQTFAVTTPSRPPRPIPDFQGHLGCARGTAGRRPTVLRVWSPAASVGGGRPGPPTSTTAGACHRRLAPADRQHPIEGECFIDRPWGDYRERSSRP
jgi:hypothetical protein